MVVLCLLVCAFFPCVVAMLFGCLLLFVRPCVCVVDVLRALLFVCVAVCLRVSLFVYSIVCWFDRAFE